MVGIVLCGGQSSRMGSDKGLLKLEAKTWAQTAVDKLAALDILIKISVNTQQYPAYEAVFSADDLFTDNPSLSLKGPLLGVLSAHLQYPSEDLFVLACDMPLMEPSLVVELNAQSKLEPSYEAYIFTNDGEPEPLCGIYRGNGLSRILEMLQTGHLPRHSMKFMLENLNTRVIPATREQQPFFRNFNAHAELNGG